MRSPQVGTAPAAVSQTANAAQVKRHAPRREILKTGYGEQPPPCRPAGGGNGEAYAARNPQQALALKRNASSKPTRPAQDPTSPPQGRPNADLSGQGKTKKLEMEQRRKRKNTGQPANRCGPSGSQQIDAQKNPTPTAGRKILSDQGKYSTAFGRDYTDLRNRLASEKRPSRQKT